MLKPPLGGWSSRRAPGSSSQQEHAADSATLSPGGAPAVQFNLARIPLFHHASTSSNSSGGVMQSFESRFGTSFADVRIHSDGAAHQRVAGMGARALTHGSDIYFAQGHFQPGTRSGQALLAHELAHVVQQRNGRFPSSSLGSQPASRRLSLEREADTAAMSAAQSGPISVKEASQSDEVHGDVGEMMAVARQGLEALADWAVSKAAGVGSAVLGQVNALRQRLRGVSQLLVSPEVAARFEAIYQELKSGLPFWFPTPTINFGGGPTQQAGAVAIPLAAILLFLAFIIVVLYYAGNFDPATRRARERAAQEVVDKILESLKPKQEPQQQPKPEPEPRPRPLGPDLIPEAPRRAAASKVADSNVFMDRVEGGPAQRLRIDTAYLANPGLTLFVPATAVQEATRVDPHGTQAARLAGKPGGARIVPDVDGNVEPLRPTFNKILSAKFGEADLRIALRARERALPLVTTNAAMERQMRDPSFPERVRELAAVAVEIP